jgi:hypothetical protein
LLHERTVGLIPTGFYFNWIRLEDRNEKF